MLIPMSKLKNLRMTIPREEYAPQLPQFGADRSCRSDSEHLRTIASS